MFQAQRLSGQDTSLTWVSKSGDTEIALSHLGLLNPQNSEN